MTRQTALALGVALFVAIVATPHTPHTPLERLAAFDRAWWVMAAVVMLSLIPLVWLTAPKARHATASAETP